MTHFTDRPCAGPGLKSYRYRGRYGWIMVGALDERDAMREASRSTDEAVVIDRLERWDDEAGRYVPCDP